MTPLLVALGGALGASLRYLVGRRLATTGFPWATLLVNVAGCLLLGVVSGSSVAWVRTGLGTGLAGALTTYSAYALDAVLLDRNGHRSRAAWSIAANLGLGIAAFALGRLLTAGV